MPDTADCKTCGGQPDWMPEPSKDNPGYLVCRTCGTGVTNVINTKDQLATDWNTQQEQ